jgi:hypothetical protein
MIFGYHLAAVREFLNKSFPRKRESSNLWKIRTPSFFRASDESRLLSELPKGILSLGDENMKKMSPVVISTLMIGLITGGCASVTPTKETQSSYAIYDIKPTDKSVTASKLANAIKVALQKNMSGVQLSTGIPASTLPKQPGRFQLVNPLGGSNMSALAALSGQSLQVPVCDGAILTANARDTSMGQYGEGTSFFLCLMPYQGGYNLDIYTSFTRLSGGLSADILGATLARAVVGDSSQFIPRTIKSVVDEVQLAGGTTKLLESYP